MGSLHDTGYALRQKQDRNDQDQAVDNEIIGVGLAPEHATEHILRRPKDDRTEQRPDQAQPATKHGCHQEFEIETETKHLARVDKGRELRKEGAACTGNAAADANREHLCPGHVDAHRLGSVCAFADRGEIVAEPAALDAIRQQQRKQQQSQRDEQILCLVGKTHRPGVSLGDGNADADGFASQRPVEEDHHEDLGHGDGEETEIVVLQPVTQAQSCHQDRSKPASQPTQDQIDPGADAKLTVENAVGIGADAEEGDVADQQLAGQAACDRPTYAHDGEDDRQDNDLQFVGRSAGTEHSCHYDDKQRQCQLEVQPV